jgi:hypothetical protein
MSQFFVLGKLHAMTRCATFREACLLAKWSGEPASNPALVNPRTTRIPSQRQDRDAELIAFGNYVRTAHRRLGPYVPTPALLAEFRARQEQESK